MFLHKNHYYYVSDVGRLLSKTTKEDYLRKRFFCYGCLSSFDRMSRLKKHDILCSGKHLMIPCFPKTTLKFEDWWATLSPPYVVYYDLETLYAQVDGKKQMGSSTTLINELKPFMIG